MRTTTKVFVTIMILLNYNLSFAKNGNIKKDSIPISELNKYIDKDVYLLLLDDNIRGYKSIRFFDRKTFVLSGIVLTFDNGMQLEVYISKFKYQKPYSLDRNWSMELFYKEKIAKIEVRRK
jgi:hypothetical protein